MPISRNSLQCFFERAAVFCVIATCFVIPFATALLSLFATLTLVFWLLSGKVLTIPALIKIHAVAAASLFLFVLFIIGLLYSPAELSDSLSFFKKYRELLFIPVVISLLNDNETAKRRCEYSFICGCIVLLLISYAMYLSVVPVAKYGYSIVFHITHSFFMSILVFWAAHKTLESRQHRLFWFLIVIITLYNLFNIAPGRTGMLLFPVLMILLFIQKFTWRQQIAGFVLLILLLCGVYTTSENFATRTRQAFNEIQQYEYGASKTSQGQRLDWWINSITLIKEKPFFGHGTGAFPLVHKKLISGTDITPTDNPHNEFLLIGVQLGVIGILSFCFLLFTQLKESFRLKKPDRFLVQGVIVAMAAGCLMNSFLFDSHQGHFFAFLTAVFFSSTPDHHT